MSDNDYPIIFTYGHTGIVDKRYESRYHRYIGLGEVSGVGMEEPRCQYTQGLSAMDYRPCYLIPNPDLKKSL